MIVAIRRILGAAVLAVLLGLVPASGAAAAPTPAPPEFLGANLQALFRQGFVKTGFEAYLTRQSQAGLTIARFDAPWMYAQPQEGGPYTWATLDSIAAQLASHNLRWQPVLDLPPNWAKTSGMSLSPARYGEFAAFAGAFTARYGANGSFWAARPDLPRLPVTQLEVWTEANSSHFWAPAAGAGDATEYLALFRRLRGAIKAADPAVQVLLSLGWQDFAGFMTRWYAAGGAGNTDGVAFHPYAPTAGGVVKLTRDLRDILTKAGEPDLPIFMTEIGWPTAPSGPGATRAYDGPVSDAARAATASLTADALAASDCNVKSYVFYSLVEEQKNPANVEDWLGIINADGSPTRTLDALAGSALRWRGASGLRATGASSLLPLCHGPSGERATSSATLMPDGRMPIQLSFPARPTEKCFLAKTTYYSNPLEDVSVFLRTYRGASSGVVTKASGQGQLCMSAQSRRNPFIVYARSRGLAAAQSQYCKNGRCYPLQCTKGSIRVRRSRPAAGRLRLAVSVRCGRRTLFAAPIKVTAVLKGGRALKRLAAFRTSPAVAPKSLTLTLPRGTTSIRVRYGGDRAFKLDARTRELKVLR